VGQIGQNGKMFKKEREFDISQGCVYTKVWSQQQSLDQRNTNEINYISYRYKWQEGKSLVLVSIKISLEQKYSRGLREKYTEESAVHNRGRNQNWEAEHQVGRGT
jgi:hypothetical protein